MEINKIYNEDCFETMNKMPNEFIDLIITSPPYNTSRKNTNDLYNDRYDEYIDCKTDDEYINWTINLFNHYDKILKKNSCILYNISYSSENTYLIWHLVSDIIRKTNFITADCIIWKKNSAIPNNRSKNKLTRICEFIFVFVRKNELETFICNKKEISKIEKTGQSNYENIFNFIEAKNNDGSNELNKATYSSELVRKLLRIYNKKDSLIYDSFMGTGTTAKACLMENINFIGSELSKKQVDFANKRLVPFLTQKTLF